MFYMKQYYPQVFHNRKFLIKKIELDLVPYKIKNYVGFCFCLNFNIENFHSFSTILFHVKQLPFLILFVWNFIFVH